MKRMMFIVLTVLLAFFISACKAAGDGKVKDNKAQVSTEEGGCIPAGEITFKYIPEDGDEPESVYLAGDINGWNPSDPNYMFEEEDGEFVIEIELDPGVYKYKYVIDGEWVQSMEDLSDQIKPTPTEFVDDGFGGRNAVIEVCE